MSYQESFESPMVSSIHLLKFYFVYNLIIRSELNNFFLTKYVFYQFNITLN